MVGGWGKGKGDTVLSIGLDGGTLLHHIWAIGVQGMVFSFVFGCSSLYLYSGSP